MVKVKSQAEIQANYATGATVAPARFEAGVRSATWQQEALAGQDLYEQQMQRPEILSRRATGIGKVSDATWRDNAISKGRAVIKTRMTAAAGKMAAGFAPYATALSAYTLPAKTTDPQQNVINRVGGVVKVMTDTKAQQG